MPEPKPNNEIVTTRIADYPEDVRKQWENVKGYTKPKDLSTLASQRYEGKKYHKRGGETR